MRKNVVLGLIAICSITLSACTNEDNSKVESLEETISSLENENADLKEQLSKEEASSEKVVRKALAKVVKKQMAINFLV